MVLTREIIEKKVKMMEKRDKSRQKKRAENLVSGRKQGILPVTPGVYPNDPTETPISAKVPVGRVNRQKGQGKDAPAPESKPIIPPVVVDTKKFNTAFADAGLDKMGYLKKDKNNSDDAEMTLLAERKLIEMHCPNSSMRGWDCNKVENGKELEHPFYTKGEEPQCLNGNFVNCPSYRAYFNFRIADRARRQGKEKGAKRKGT